MISPRQIFALLACLIILRAGMAGLLPLSADEAYYWLWSKHLAAGYFDHPPVIAFLIRAGTTLFGDTAFGVRAFDVVCSVPATWFVWDTARLLLREEKRAALAALLFNLTLMMGVELLAATPDMPSIVTSAAYVWALVKVQDTNNGRYWLAVGVAAGLGLLSKYSALFLGAGTLVWLLASPPQRHWFKSIWPWTGGLLAAAIFAPNLWWQSAHHWETFAFQFGRIGNGPFTARFVLEFLGAQIGLATPLIFALAMAGLWRARRRDDERFVLTALLITAIAYFLFHALRDRVQGNWPCFLYPALAILAADVFTSQGRWRWPSLLAMPLAGLMLLLVYAQALWGILPLKNDPLARLLGSGIPKFAQAVEKTAGSDAVLTTDYETTAWLRFYAPGLTVVQLGETFRYPDAPAPSPALLAKPLLYVAEEKRDQSALLRRYFGTVEAPVRLRLAHGGTTLATYAMVTVVGPRAAIPARLP